MEENISLIEPLIQRVEEYGKTTLHLIRLKAIDKTTDVASSFISKGIIFYTFSMFIVIANIGAALWIGEQMGKIYYGFFCVAGFYGIVGIALRLFMYKGIKERVSNSIISQLLN